ncbi:hydrolase [Aureococcus anophagefferens]|nr:hydrolase [Aureococcus anophagefferens]
MGVLRVAAVQLRVSKDRASNLRRAAELIDAAAADGARFVALPECFTGKYGVDLFAGHRGARRRRRRRGGRVRVRVPRRAKRHGVVATGGVIEEHAGKLYNTMPVYGPDGALVASYRKVHLSRVLGITSESDVLEAGDEATAFESGGVRVGMACCFDLRFPEWLRRHGPRGAAPADVNKLILALSLTGASAFVAPTTTSAPMTQVQETKADLVALQESLPGPPGYWDPLSLAGSTILSQWGLTTEEENIGWWRHAEIKHGRVAMAGFLGFVAQCTPLVSGEHGTLPYRGYVAGVTPQEQWDNILLAKLQIFIAIGMLESTARRWLAEGYVHYTKGGQPGYYPDIKGRVAGQIQLNLYDPFQFGFASAPEAKASAEAPQRPPP